MTHFLYFSIFILEGTGIRPHFILKNL
uniref:Uncharacterized protein n=1 Tax=Anguilla anguilla TaxID=7936 RepID=A0A0E9TK22_ANGAN